MPVYSDLTTYFRGRLSIAAEQPEILTEDLVFHFWLVSDRAVPVDLQKCHQIESTMTADSPCPEVFRLARLQMGQHQAICTE